MVLSTGAILSKAISSLTVPSAALRCYIRARDAAMQGTEVTFPREACLHQKCIKILSVTALDPPIFCLKSRATTAAYNITPVRSL